MVQVILDIDTVERSITDDPGNWYSRDVQVEVKPGNAGEAHLYLERRIPERLFRRMIR